MNASKILRVVVGSRAHGLAGENSDYDYRAVFVAPTTEILKLGSKVKNTNWIEGNEDNTSWEIGHFLNLATHCNPTILEVFLAPVEEATEWGEELRRLFPYVWNSDGVMNAFIGYGLNQRKKFFDNRDNRAAKYAAAYLRTLFNAYELLTKNTFTVRIADLPFGEVVRAFKEGRDEPGELIDRCLYLEKMIKETYASVPKKETDYDKVNEFLLKVRREFWV